MSNIRSELRFTAEFELDLDPGDIRTIRSRFEAARHVYNAALQESLRRRQRMLESRAFQAARLMPQGTNRTRLFRQLNSRFGLTEFELDRWSARRLGRTWLAAHLQAQLRRELARRALRATLDYQLRRRGHPRFKGPNQIDSISGQDTNACLRLKGTTLHWNGSSLPLNDHGEPARLRHALGSDIRRIRIVRRRIRQRERYYVQLVCAGLPYGSLVPRSTARVGIDPGLRYLAIATPTDGRLIRIESTSHSAVISRLTRALGRKRRLNGGIDSRTLKKLRGELRDAHRRSVEARLSLHGRIAKSILRLGTEIFIEKNSFLAFQRRYGRTILRSAPASMIRLLAHKAANAGGRVELITPRLRLSQICHGCGEVTRKDLDTRIHSCPCGIGPVQRDIYSAWLAIMTRSDPSRSVRWLDADLARTAWSGAEQRLPAASSLLSIAAFEAWVETQVASNDGMPIISPKHGTERFAGVAQSERDEARNVVGHRPRVRESRAELRHMRDEAVGYVA